MIRQRPILHVLATLLSIVVFGLMLTAAGQLVIGGPFAQRVLAALPGGTARPELIPDAIGGARPIEPSAPIVSDRVGVDPPVVGFGRADVERETRDHELRASKLPEIRVSKQRISAAAVEPGETVEFAIEVTNSGSTPLTEVYVADSYAPAWLEFLDADPPPNQVDPEAGTVTWTDLESLISDSGLAVEGRLRIALRFRAKAAPPDGRPIVNRARAGARERNVSDGPAEDRVTIVTPATLCLGDLVFVEREQDGHYDAAQGDLGVADVALRLFADSDASGAWTPEDRELVSTRTDASGRYRFCGLSPGAYLVVVDPSNFDRGGPLALLVSSSLNGIDLIGDPNDDRDDDDNGSPTGARGLIASAAMRLSPGEEPGPDQDGDDRSSNRTLDFGFVLARPDVSAPPPLESLPPAEAVEAPPAEAVEAPPPDAVDGPPANSADTPTTRPAPDWPSRIPEVPRLPRTGHGHLP